MGDKKTYYVYEHWTPDGYVYVGVTKNPKNRWKAHRYRKCKGLFAEAIDRFGWKNIIHRIVAEFDNRKDALKLEDELICQYRDDGICLNNIRSGLITINKSAYRIQLRKDNQEFGDRLRAASLQYYYDHKDDDGYKDKSNERSHIWYQEHKDDPEFKTKRTERNRKWYQQHKDDPEFKAKNAEKTRQYRLKKKQSQSDNLGIAS